MIGTDAAPDTKGDDFPRWLPDAVRHYLSHTVGGQPIRTLAREAGVHASTILRQVRRMETRRDDPLVDAGLRSLGAARDEGGLPVTLGELEQGAGRILRRLCETGAVLAVAEGMEKAVVVRGGADSVAARTAVVDTDLAQAMALMDWITCSDPGRVSRYRVTAAGRMALGRILAREENRARAAQETGMAEAPAGFVGAPQGAACAGKRARYGLSESPLAALARRRDRDGQPFLGEGLVSAGERLREDFELAQMGPRTGMNWDRFLTGGGRGTLSPGDSPGGGAAAARDRVARALSDLGPGLSDVALRCCCFLEGLEMAEKKMGWSARSGKIVLRIALQRLRLHYEGEAAADRMIG